MVTVNLNDYVWIQLKPKGYFLLRQHYVEQARQLKTKVDEIYGVSVDELLQRILLHEPDWEHKPVRMQLWQLIKHFGPILSGHFNDLFDNEIGIEVPE